MEPYGVQGKLRVGWGCVVMSCGGIVVTAVMLSSMVTAGFSLIVAIKVVIALLSVMGIISVGIVIIGVGSLGLGVVLLVVGGMQHAGGLLHAGELT